jgi:2-oxoglutarate/2-oxoacid ferredoxin oxidoreductase subunit alpha
MLGATTAEESSVAGEAPVESQDYIVEIISDSGEGAQKCGQSFGAIAARTGFGIWTVEIIPAEIEPPARSIAGASGNRIRVGSHHVSNAGDEADIVVAFNEQVLLGRERAGEFKKGCTILLEDKWKTSKKTNINEAYAKTVSELREKGYRLIEIPMEVECLKLVSNPRRGKNMFALGLLCSVFDLSLDVARDQIALTFKKKGQEVIDSNIGLLGAGQEWATENLDLHLPIHSAGSGETKIVVNGNTAVGLGVMASGMEVCAMYPITPATSASHYLADVFESAGGMVHQAEDEIAACCFAIGASYAGKTAVTITSGPGYSLKQEALGLAVMGEIPLVVVNVQRGGPSTGQPTKVEQGDLLAACFGSHGDAPKIVMAAANIEDCFYSIITARKLAETYRTVVVVLTDANLATSQQPFTRPVFKEHWLAPSVDQSPVPEGAKPYDWDPVTGLAERFVPGRPGGMHALTGLVHDRTSRLGYDPNVNQEGIKHRSLKLAAFQKTLKPPQVHGDDCGELLVVGWGSTKGAIEEAVDRLLAEGKKVSSMHLTYLQPLAGGIGNILSRFQKVLAVEIGWADSLDDELIDADNRRYSNLAWLLRGRFLVDVDCWCEVKGQPIKPRSIVQAIRERLA